MNAIWATVAIVAVIALGTVIGVLRRGGKRQDRRDAILAQLTAIGGDHANGGYASRSATNVPLPTRDTTSPRSRNSRIVRRTV